MNKKNRGVAVGQGVPCPRCKGSDTTKFIHPPHFVPQPGKCWFSYWFKCNNPTCQTKIFFAGGMNEPPAARPGPKISAPSREFVPDYSDMWPAMVVMDDRPPWE